MDWWTGLVDRWIGGLMDPHFNPARLMAPKGPADIIILIVIIVVLLEFAQLQFCQTVRLESLLFFKPLVFPSKVMGRQMQPLCACHVFLWPAG